MARDLDLVNMISDTPTGLTAITLHPDGRLTGLDEAIPGLAVAELGRQTADTPAIEAPITVFIDHWVSNIGRAPFLRNQAYREDTLTAADALYLHGGAPHPVSVISITPLILLGLAGIVIVPWLVRRRQRRKALKPVAGQVKAAR